MRILLDENLPRKLKWSLDADALLKAVREYEAIDDTIGRVMSYIVLRYQQNTSDPARAKAFGDARTRVTDLSAPLVFFTLELNKIDEATLTGESVPVDKALAPVTKDAPLGDRFSIRLLYTPRAAHEPRR